MKLKNWLIALGLVAPMVACAPSKTVKPEEKYPPIKKGDHLNFNIEDNVVECNVTRTESRKLYDKDLNVIDCFFNGDADVAFTTREKGAEIIINYGRIDSAAFDVVCNAGKCGKNTPELSDYAKKVYEKMYETLEAEDKGGPKTVEKIAEHIRENSIAHEAYHVRFPAERNDYKGELGAFLSSMIHSPSYAVFAIFDEAIRQNTEPYKRVGETIFREFESRGYSKEDILDIPLKTITNIAKRIYRKHF